ncbi:MAG: sulfatase [Bryobacteraceae bacterium]
MLSRRNFLSAAAAAAGRLSAQNDRPNILFLLTDDQRWDALGCMGNRIIQTPHIDRLSERGVTFTNQFVTTSICMTSRACIFTGQYARAHGIHDFAKPFTEEQFSRTYPALLRAAGYHTGFIGKYGVGNAMPESKFDYWAGFPGQGHYFPQGENGKHLTEIMGDQALQFLNAVPDGKRFCLSISFKAPHVQDQDPRQFLHSRATADLYSDVTIPVPRTASPKYTEIFPPEMQRSENRRRWAVRFATPQLYQASVKSYYRLITEVDTVVGRLREHLARTGADRNTVIVFTADNGFYLSEHGFAGKWFMHEESIRVPLIVYDPRLPNASAGARRTQMTLNIDLAPTVLTAAGLTPPVPMQGRNLYPLCEGNPKNWRSEWFYEHLFNNNGWIPPSEGVRSERWKYFRYPGTTPLFEEIYDLQADPREERNLAKSPQHAAQLDKLSKRVGIWRQSLDAWNGATAWRDPAVESI